MGSATDRRMFPLNLSMDNLKDSSDDNKIIQMMITYELTAYDYLMVHLWVTSLDQR